MNITLSISGIGESLIRENQNVKWTEIARQAILEEAIRLKKQELISKQVKKEAFTKSDLDFMELQDWHPVDEFKLKKEFVQEVLSSSESHFKKHGFKHKPFTDLENFKE